MGTVGLTLYFHSTSPHNFLFSPPLPFPARVMREGVVALLGTAFVLAVHVAPTVGACDVPDEPLCGYIYNFDECSTAAIVLESCPSMCGLCGATTTTVTTTVSSSTATGTETSTTTTRTSLLHDEICTDHDLCGTSFAYSECFNPVFAVVRDNCPCA